MKHTRSLLLLTIACLCLLLTACGSTPAQSHITVTPRATRTTPASTNCPPAGTGRAATMPPLSQPLGHHQNLVYISDVDDQPTSGSLVHYDVTTGSKTTILTLKNANIAEAQLSTDGQWILFTDQIYNPAIHSYGVQMLQLIRIDGKALQTLYCAPQGTASLMLTWSPDQQHVAFFGGKKEGDSFAGVSTFDLHTGKVQLVLDDPSGLATLFWKNDQQLYIRFAQMIPTSTLYMLDTTRGPNQHVKDLTLVFQQQTSKPCWNAAASFDRSTLFISQCTPAPTNWSGAPYQPSAPSSVSQQAATGGSLHTITTTKQLTIVDVHAVSPDMLLFNVASPITRRGETDSRDGLWKVNTDGSGLLQLMHEGSANGNGNEEPAWHYVSRDGMLYVYSIWNWATTQNTLKYGSLSGGPTTAFATSNKSDSATIVGWTVL
ncbi:hypothetical protein KSF_002720 [Reticulibacter mediterranei]|uniref:Uncharacterized protein n=1 Tax=Reticulibacter mediterranei TaxID=2778369 RepID=A0A8J3I7H1_9CHLR|nr:hypothetical protein [Reticulibacter mediterranei]GHO90224.1 hypothetical protein KSF_002720 [Reticulibacter mediterranei]